jgi:hypothetical protein
LEITASLPLDWVSTVWGPGISEPAGRMVLAVRSAAAGGHDPVTELVVDIAEWHPDGIDRWEAVRRTGRLARSQTDSHWELDVVH